MTCCRSEADTQAASLRSQAAAREERLNAQHACRIAALQSELDDQGAAAAETEAALSAAQAQLTHLAGQVGGVPWGQQLAVPTEEHAA